MMKWRIVTEIILGISLFVFLIFRAEYGNFTYILFKIVFKRGIVSKSYSSSFFQIQMHAQPV